MEEEEILGVNLDELSSLFSDTGFLGGESFGWGLAPYRNVVVNDEGTMVKDDNVVLYIDSFGDANLSSKMWMYQKRDPLDAYDEPEFSKTNLFVKGLAKAIPGVPPYGIILMPWYEVEDARRDLKELKFPDDTPEGFVPCNGYLIEIDGKKFRLPNLVSRTVDVGGGDNEEEETTYFAPPGCTYMMRLPDGISTQGLTAKEDTYFGQYVDFRGKLRIWGNPANPFETGRLFY